MSTALRSTMSESDMLRTFADLAAAAGGHMWHVRHAQGQRLEGLPDVIIAAPPIVGLFELKTQHDRVSPVQQAVMASLSSCDHIVSGIVRPVPKHAGEISLDEALNKIVCLRRDLELFEREAF